MYDLPWFKEMNDEVVKQFMADNPFAFLVGSDEAHQPVATQVPVFFEEREGKKIITGHIMVNTDHYRTFRQNNKVLVVFTGPHAYVSATWYNNLHTASTWNYMSVHAKGVIRMLDEKGLIEILRKTTLHFEGYNPGSATIYDNLPQDHVHKLMKQIAAFEIEVIDLKNVFKLSQNRDEKSYMNIKEKLCSMGGEAEKIAEEMERRTNELFPGVKEADSTT